MREIVLEIRALATPHGLEVGVQGPLENTTLCYGLLEEAKEVIWEQGKRKRESSIITLDGMVRQ